MCLHLQKASLMANPIYSLATTKVTLWQHQVYGYKWPSLLSQMAFCQPCKTMKVNFRDCGAREQH